MFQFKFPSKFSSNRTYKVGAVVSTLAGNPHRRMQIRLNRYCSMFQVTLRLSTSSTCLYSKIQFETNTWSAGVKCSSWISFCIKLRDIKCYPSHIFHLLGRKWNIEYFFTWSFRPLQSQDNLCDLPRAYYNHV